MNRAQRRLRNLIRLSYDSTRKVASSQNMGERIANNITALRKKGLLSVAERAAIVSELTEKDAVACNSANTLRYLAALS